MDAFERARLKHAKHLERKERTQGKTAAKVESPEVPSSPKEKGKEKGTDTSAVIEVVVRLPDVEYKYTFIKPAVYQNATKSKLTRSEFKNRITEGLRPLLGGLNELPVRGD